MSAVMREGAYRGGSRMAADWDRADDGPPEPDDDEHQDVDEPEPEPDDDEHQDVDEPEPADDGGRSAGSSTSWGQDGAGWALGLLAWGWVALPFLQGGPERVKAVLMAKFLNRAPDGSELP